MRMAYLHTKPHRNPVLIGPAQVASVSPHSVSGCFLHTADGQQIDLDEDLDQVQGELDAALNYTEVSD